MFKNALVIPIFVFTDEEMDAIKLGMGDENGGLQEVEYRAFWYIDSAHKFRENKNYTVFYLNDESFVTPQPINRFIKQIDNQENR